MIIHLYTMCWNEAELLPFFFRHYEKFCDRIVVYDNGSDDGSQRIVQQHRRAELRHKDTGGQLAQEHLLDIKGHAWKESRGRADWVICCDVDELLWHRDLIGFLFACKDRGITIPVPVGLQMVSDHFPVDNGWGQIYEQVNQGFFDAIFCKSALFDPNAIREIGYTAGCHSADPQGAVKILNDPAFKLLHFKFLGLDYLRARYAALYGRQSESDRALGQSWGYQYAWPPDELASRFAQFKGLAGPIRGFP